MNIKTSVFLLALLFLFPAIGVASEYDQHVAFDNSVAPEAFYYSEASVVAPSELQIARNKVPVATGRFVSPPNSLRLSWTSRFGGDWHVQIKTRVRYGSQEFKGHTLAFWAYSEDELLPDETPRIGLHDSDGTGTPQISLIGRMKSLPGGRAALWHPPAKSLPGHARESERRQAGWACPRRR